MGVKGLWTLLEPAARPVRLEALTHKRLAVDASIWLYQLIKAMKDQEGNPVEDAHILGFYRRICKLLYYGIKPIFVFDGGAPELKRATINERQMVRGTRNNDAKRAAHQLLQTQLKLHAIGGLPKPDEGLNTEEAQSPSKKRKRDEYELPPIQKAALATRHENEGDLRMAHPEDLNQLLALASRESGSMDGVDLDINSAEFKALSPEDQHDLIVALKVKSRQTSHDRLQQMLSSSNTSLDFSKQQIDLLVKRNTLTQQWLQVTGNSHRTTSLDKVTVGRVAGERGREYILTRSDQLEGGWTLMANGDKENNSAPIVVNSSDVELEEALSESEHSFAEDPVDRGSNGYTANAEDTNNHSRYSVYSQSSSIGEAATVSSDCDSDMDARLMDLYSECDALDIVSPQQQQLMYQQQLREQREREEQAILELPASEFLDTWAQLVTQPMLDIDPHLYQNMRTWLMDISPEELQLILWRTNRRLEKLPDVPLDDSDSDNETDGNVDGSGASAGANDIGLMQAKVSRLSLMSNYLSFVQRWKKRHKDVPPSGSEVDASPMADAPMDSDDVISVKSESSDEDEEFEMPQIESGLDQEQSCKDVDIKDEVMGGSPVHQHIFERVRELAPEEPKTHIPPVSIAANSTQHLDSGSIDDDISITEAESQSVVEDSDSAASEHSDLESEDDDLDVSNSKQTQLLQDEQDEYARFFGKLKASGDDLAKQPTYGAMRAELENEMQALRMRMRDSKRDASGVEADMVEDIRVLLTLFGIPYITAPMEAEAQCASLIAAQLVDGMITDDSDAFLFASSRSTKVYRHFFQKDRYVEMYSAEAVFQDSSLLQRDMVFLACLLGSDYTIGIKNIGPVLAMEALAEFGPSAIDSSPDDSDEARVIEALCRFRAWCDKVTEVLPGIELPEELTSSPMRQRLAQVVRKSGVPPSFPNPRVVHAYFQPQVDASETRFEWGFPKLDMLRQFLAEKLGWSTQKTDETLVPLVRKMVDAEEEGKIQTTLDAFTAPDARLSSIYNAAGVGHSKRVGAAILSHKQRQTADRM
ncbi:DNA repair protein rad2 [Coemansia sp. RSA 2336]|nr:DNA repair protein rad2 [Coemansia sp. RSA 2336]